ncbi:MAG: hypothetical protein ACUVUU_03525 [bacterium]
MKKLLVASLLILLLANTLTAKETAGKWFGIGGEITGEKRWLGRFGLTPSTGIEAIFALSHESIESMGFESNYTRVCFGAGLIHDFNAQSSLTPYIAGRFMLNVVSIEDTDTSVIIEAAGGLEYLLLKRVGIRGELDFTLGTDPTTVTTSTRVSALFYF